MLDKSELLRVVRSPDGDYAIDETGKAPGRGAYVCRDADCAKMLAKSRGLDRSFKGKVPLHVYEGIAQGTMTGD